MKERVYWHPSFVPGPEQLSLDEAAEALEETLGASVATRMQADVPVGSYLSGGIDSSVITALAARTGSRSLDTFSIRFADPRFDETQEQRRIAGHFGTSHHDFLCGAADIAGNLADVVWRCETPLMRTAPVPLYLLSRLVRDAGRKVVLSGEGSDELLAGYPIFKETAIRRFWARAPESAIRPLLFDRLYPDVRGADRSPAMWRHYFSHRCSEVSHPFYSHLLRWQNCGWAIRFLAPEVRGAADPDTMMNGLAGLLPPGWQDWGPLERAQAIELTSFMSSYLLSCQGDRVAMAHSVEVRYPFLDPAVIRLCCSFSAQLKMLGLRDKRPLRKLGSRLLPGQAALLPKRPFRAPVAYTLFGPGSPAIIGELLADAALARQPMIDSDSAALLVRKARLNQGRMVSEREEMALIGLVTLQMMSEMYTTGFSVRARDAEAALRRGRPGVSVLAEAGGGMA
jgi:asparagine synthase (glutamine-hydrolysing)